MLDILLKMFERMGVSCRVVSSISRSLTLCRYSCRESISMVKCCFRKRLRVVFISLRSLSIIYSVAMALIHFFIITQIQRLQQSYELALILLSFSSRFFSLLISSLLSSLSVVTSVISVISLIVGFFVSVIFFSLLKLGFVFLLLLWLWLTDRIPELFLFILFWFAEMVGFHEYLINVVCFKHFFGDFFIVGDTTGIKLVSKILNIFKNDNTGFVVDTAQQTLEPLSCFELNVDFIGEEFFDG